jgi:hypothetical protein
VRACEFTMIGERVSRPAEPERTASGTAPPAVGCPHARWALWAHISKGAAPVGHGCDGGASRELPSVGGTGRSRRGQVARARRCMVRADARRPIAGAGQCAAHSAPGAHWGN